MNTQLGRVVYDREKHTFKAEDVVRILKGMNAFKNVSRAAWTFGRICGLFLKERGRIPLETHDFLVAFLGELLIVTNNAGVRDALHFVVEPAAACLPYSRPAPGPP